MQSRDERVFRWCNARDITTRLQLCNGKMKNYDQFHATGEKTNANAIILQFHLMQRFHDFHPHFHFIYFFFQFLFHNCSVLVQFNCGTCRSFRWLDIHIVFLDGKKKNVPLFVVCIHLKKCVFWRSSRNSHPLAKQSKWKIYIVCTFLTAIIGSRRLVTMRTALISRYR